MPTPAVEVRGDEALELRAGEGAVELLLLQGRPIGEPVAHHGPFVTNTQEELRQAFVDYQRTGFGGWPWESDGPVHPEVRGTLRGARGRSPRDAVDAARRRRRSRRRRRLASRPA